MVKYTQRQHSYVVKYTQWKHSIYDDTYILFIISAQVVSHPPKDHRMELQSSHSEEVELRLSQSDDIDVRGEVSEESRYSDNVHSPVLLFC